MNRRGLIISSVIGAKKVLTLICIHPLGFLFAPKEVDNSFCSLRRVEGVAVEIVSDLCIDLFQLQITHKPQQTGQRKWGDNGNSVGLQSDFACFLKLYSLLTRQTGGLDDGWFWQGDDSVWENAVCIIPEHLSRHFRIYFYNTADSVVQFQRCLLFCDKLKRSGLLYKRSARFVCHQQLLCQLSPIDKVSGRCMLGADILLYEVMSACMKSMLVFLLLFFAFLCPPFWINKSSTIFNDDADLTAGLSVCLSACVEAILISNMYYYQKFQEGNLQAEQYLLKFATENVVIISIVELMVMLDIVGFWFLDH
ncbi:hypothetical protein T4B_15542 [Trichinella pseudospiralis]|uniref:Uncharacterized protein n=1 Tax=Trichinella pseudospiralis TaxID=6337 RepID=A0A0V1JAK8_TRIPS|nr:hypothetical protein T4B_15542 [Trichinella pseudospiralis]